MNDTLISFFHSGDQLRSRSVSKVVLTGTVDVPQPPARLLADWDRNPVLERLEENRVLHLASSHFQMVEAVKAQQRAARQEAVLRRLLDSSAFAVAERLSRLRVRAGIARDASVVSKDDIRRALSDD